MAGQRDPPRLWRSRSRRRVVPPACGAAHGRSRSSATAAELGRPVVEAGPSPSAPSGAVTSRWRAARSALSALRTRIDGSPGALWLTKPWLPLARLSGSGQHSPASPLPLLTTACSSLMARARCHEPGSGWARPTVTSTAVARRRQRASAVKAAPARRRASTHGGTAPAPGPKATNTQERLAGQTRSPQRTARWSRSTSIPSPAEGCRDGLLGEASPSGPAQIRTTATDVANHGSMWSMSLLSDVFPANTSYAPCPSGSSVRPRFTSGPAPAVFRRPRPATDLEVVSVSHGRHRTCDDPMVTEGPPADPMVTQRAPAVRGERGAHRLSGRRGGPRCAGSGACPDGHGGLEGAPGGPGRHLGPPSIDTRSLSPPSRCTGTGTPPTGTP
jgi:hypothetical protein